jgi:hypothetical protein
LFASGAAAVPRGAGWGFVFGLPAGCYFFCTLPYGGGIIAGPLVTFAGPLAGALVGFHLGAATGLYRAGYRWALLLVPALAAAVAFVLYGLYVRAGPRPTSACDASCRRASMILQVSPVGALESVLA